MLTKYDVASIAAINGLDDGEYHKLTAKRQRELFGLLCPNVHFTTSKPVPTTISHPGQEQYLLAFSAASQPFHRSNSESQARLVCREAKQRRWQLLPQKH
jgi:hypothetical protein